MKLTLVQMGMRLLLGIGLPMGAKQSVGQRILTGRDYLVRVARKDFGFDPLRWHEYHWESDAGGYRGRKRNKEARAKRIAQATQGLEWQKAIQELLADGALPPNKLAE